MPDPRGERGEARLNWVGRIVRAFLSARLSVLFIILAALLGFWAVQSTPREEEPQIVVPLADVFVQAPGASAQEVEQLVATPLERLLWQIDGVEHVYSMSRPGLAIVTVRFFVGQDRERSLIKLHNKISMNQDLAPALVKGWVVKPVEIDDVPILAITLYSGRHDDHVLRRVGEEVLARLAEVPDVSRTQVVGGRQREVRVELDPVRLAGFGLGPLAVRQALAGADVAVLAGSLDQADRSYNLHADSFLASAREVAELVVGVHQGRPVYLRDVAEVLDGPQEAVGYSRLGFSWREQRERGVSAPAEGYPAVTLALAKKKGTNAVRVAEAALARLEELRAEVIPDGVELRVTRNYGQTAQHKSDELIHELFFAVLTVVVLLALTLGWREALVVALSVPLSFALALFVNHLLGYTINRVTMFALILSLGLVVDDPIINVDNIQRHIILGRRRPREATLEAVQEVLPPVIMSTLTIVVAFLPMFFITGMMGPYMAPMAANVPLAVGFSMVCALTVVPWLCHLLLKHRAPGWGGAAGPGGAEPQDPTPDWLRRGYARVLGPFLEHRAWRWGLAGGVTGLLLMSLALVPLRQVPLKLLPFDNKNELQLVLDLPEGTTLETSDRAVRAFEDYLAGVPEVTDFVSYTGLASPMDFNGLVRHYYLRQGGHVAEVRVNLLPKERRSQQSHAIALRLRDDLTAIARAHGVNLKIVETPPGPPVLATVVAEVYGPPELSYPELLAAARDLTARLAAEPLVVDVDDSGEAERPRLDFALDKEKAALHGVPAQAVAASLRLALSGEVAATVHAPGERQALPVRLVLPRVWRSSPAGLGHLPLNTAAGPTVPLAELGQFTSQPEEQPILHKDLKRVVFAYAETAGRAPAEVVLALQRQLEDQPLPHRAWADWVGEGEWQITVQVFRDLGLAFAAALVGIYILLVVQTNSFLLPGLLMLAIPLTLIGILPGFWLLNLAAAGSVGGYPDPTFFTATSMIGMIALGGIVIRNSVVLIDFVQESVERGLALEAALLESGAVRLRPILLTAMTTALGAWPITLDPIFSGLAWALIFGLFASTAFTLLVIPVSYYAFYAKSGGGRMTE
ncbi:MAG: efflux RND transporter permease subunit [Desulfarculus sp.]|nr:efflux RND transporter permease subunit [Desulfarculus sp.]